MGRICKCFYQAEWTIINKSREGRMSLIEIESKGQGMRIDKLELESMSMP